jgi:hypothetical protein
MVLGGIALVRLDPDRTSEPETDVTAVWDERVDATTGS